ncbi:protein of unknown function [Chitinophaga sp. CF118]|uniref:DUF4198 domain-containing protein n=1 Tax=Chitinophaga sp. CF118 TaxID=1884367 RepID=UPI0008F3A847|nr:DUF4198 domain-containing protein [Chitinophaga sp. CF118]SFD62581.1 protein of unknown function [Chitinophaga sp. CF118]
MTLKKYLFAAVLMLCVHTLSAHAIWLETSTTGKIGQAQEVKVFLGEYGDNQRDSLQHWFSNTKEFTLFLIAPDGSKKKLDCVENGNNFKATFTPEVAGTYTLSIDHTIKNIYDGNKIRYYALGVVKVSNSLTGIDNMKQHAGLVLLTAPDKAHKINIPENVQLLYNKAKPAESAVTVQSPAGWSKKFTADKNGVVTFSPFWPGRYMLEGTFAEKESGKHEGAEYTGVWHCVTYCMDVEK